MRKGQKPSNQNKEQDLVITPMGPIPKDKVKTVGPGEAIRIDKSGEAIIEPSREEWAKMRGISEDLVITPGGFRSRSLVHQIEAGHVLRVTNQLHQMVHQQSEKIVADFGRIPLRPGKEPLMPKNVSLLSRVVPELGSGWIADAYWANNTGTPVSSFRTSWVVPPAPMTQSGQLIYLFNGIQNTTMIYQPVLQWGNNGEFGGNYWVVASWYADGQSGQAFHSPPVRVNEGDVLVGIMTLVKQHGTSFDYNCEFQGIANTSLPIQNAQELTWCCETLEAYFVKKCSDYPVTDRTVFSSINILTGKVNPKLNWTADNKVTDCMQHAVVVSNSSIAGEVDIYYTTPPWWYWGFTGDQVGRYLTNYKAQLTDIAPYFGKDGILKFAFLMKEPTEAWWWYWGQTADQVGQNLTKNNAQLTRIRPYRDTDGILKFAVIMTQPTKAWWWYWGQTADQVGQNLTKNNAQLTDIAPYFDKDGTLKFAVIMTQPTKAWWWYWGQTADQVGQNLTKNNAQLTDISPYLDKDGTLKFAVIMTQPTKAWWWYWGQTADQVGQNLTKNNAQLTRIRPYRDTDGILKFAVIMTQPG